MNRRTFRSLLLAGVMTAAVLVSNLSVVAVFARTLPETDPGWSVSYTANGSMSSNFRTSNLDEVIPQMQPGDEAVFRITIKNENSRSANWYMENKVISSMEDNSAASGGAYMYKLTYTSASTGANTQIYSSETVGGEEAGPAGAGLHEATSGLEDWLYLDKLSRGQSGVVELRVTLDGESQGNSYQSQKADLSMNFAVEPDASGTATSTTGQQGKVGTIVRTGDDTPFVLYLVLAGVGGVVLLVLAIAGMKMRKKAAVEAEYEDDSEEKGGY